MKMLLGGVLFLRKIKTGREIAMNMTERYQEVFNGMKGEIAARKRAGAFAALGYTSNLDVLSRFDTEILNGLLEKYLPGEDLANMKMPDCIETMEDFLRTTVEYCRSGKGGEAEIRDVSILDGIFETANGMGGTATQGALALAEVGCPSIVHLTDDSKEVCDILNSPYIYTADADGNLIHTGRVSQKEEQEIHYIMQFKKGDVIRLGSKEITIPNSNRLIITKITVNATVPFNEGYFSYIENHAEDVRSNVLSSFNCLKNRELLERRLQYVSRHVEKYRAANSHGIAYFENAHFHDPLIQELCYKMICPISDIISLNEEELKAALSDYGFQVDIEDIRSVIAGTQFLRDRFHVRKGVIVHTKDYSMYCGDSLEADIEKGLIYGNLMATSKAMNGWYGDMEKIAEVMKLPFSPKGTECREKACSDAVVVPSRYLDRPKYTIGLGDSFVAGVQICF